MNRAPAPSGVSASESLARVLFISLGFGGLAFSAIGASDALAQLPVLGAWAWPAYIAINVLPALIAILATFAPLTLVRVLAMLHGALYLVAVVLWLSLDGTTQSTGETSPWLNDYITVAVSAVAIASRTAVVVCYLLAATVAAAVLRYVDWPSLGVTIPVLDGMYMLLLNVIFAALILLLRDAGRRLDEGHEIPLSPLITFMSTAEPPVNATVLLRFGSLRAALIAMLFIVLHAALAVQSIEQVRSPAVAAVALALVSVAALLLSFPGRHPYSARLTATVLALIVVASLSVWNLPRIGWPGWSSWIWGAVTYVLFFLVLRGRPMAAWAGFAAMSAITVHWCLSTGRTLEEAVWFLVRHAGLLVVATLFGVLLELTVRRIRSAGLGVARGAIVADGAPPTGSRPGR